VPEVRVDPLSGLRTIIAPARAERPGASLARAAPPEATVTDPFAPGNESMTPPTLSAARDGDKWQVRVFANRYPAVDPEAVASEPDANPDLFASLAARGAHEVIVNSPRSVSALADLSSAELKRAVAVWRERIRAHADAACVHLFVNEGRDGGISQAHTHAQLIALDFVPALIARERERFAAYATRTTGQNLLGDLVQDEVRRRERIVAIDDEAVVIAPFASQLPYQLMLAPRRPLARFEDDGPSGAALLHDALGRLARLHGSSPPLNLWVRTAPRGAVHFCWRIDILPRLTTMAGLELGTGVGLNSVAPERAAAELRAA
jgi:UDPglucose--hexose-1-phosphate uridylyltransferase